MLLRGILGVLPIAHVVLVCCPKCGPPLGPQAIICVKGTQTGTVILTTPLCGFGSADGRSLVLPNCKPFAVPTHEFTSPYLDRGSQYGVPLMLPLQLAKQAEPNMGLAVARRQTSGMALPCVLRPRMKPRLFGTDCCIAPPSSPESRN